MPKDTEEESYESWTVAELRDELTARDLPTSGLKDELVARLEEDDAAPEADASKEVAVRDEETVIEGPVNAVHPFQLPANTAAAQAYMDANPGSVLDPATPFPDELKALAQEAIADYGDPETDPRMEDYTPPPPEVDQGPAEPESEEVTNAV
jgi:hypothetical protein